MLRRALLVLALALTAPDLVACSPPVVVFGQPSVKCGAFEGPDCNDLLEIGLDAVAGARSEEPIAVAVDNACPPNARCAPSELGGNTAAVAVRWSDGTVQWATIPLPPDWPASPAGAANEMTDPVPAHLAAAVGAG
ncbi:MAG TPA: hypothetical protein VFM38_07265 [Candidatus Limnocylindrales bacterium]|nr:hypothetical protein [Candidatus Limnocylindrales bacterium]